MIESYLITNLIRKELIGQAIHDSTKGIYGNLSVLMNDEFTFKELLESIDIISKVDIVNSFMSLLDSKKKMSDMVHKALNYLHEITEKINKEITEIKKDIETHKTLWFHNLRTPGYKSKIDNLIKHTKILDTRLDLLIKLINIKDKI